MQKVILKMKLSKLTIEILKNFSSINESLLFNQGDVIKTVAKNNVIFAKAKVKESFPKEFGIYDLNQFLSILSLYDDPELTFFDQYVSIDDSTGRLSEFYYANPDVITSPKAKGVKMADESVKFTLHKMDLAEVLKFAAVMLVPNIVIKGDGNDINIIATNHTTSASNTFSKNVGMTNETFEMVYSIDKWKFLSIDYDVTISRSGVTHFKNNDLEYWIVSEESSTYEE